MGLFGKKKPDPKKVVAECQTSVRKEKRHIERQIQSLQKDEDKAKQMIKQSAKNGVTDATTRNLASVVVKSRKLSRRLQNAKFRLDSLELTLQQERSAMRVSGAVESSAQVMSDVAQLIKVPELQKSLGKMSKELMKIGLIEEMTNDAIGSAVDDDSSVDTDDQAEIDKVLSESTGSSVTAAVRTQRASIAAGPRSVSLDAPGRSAAVSSQPGAMPADRRDTDGRRSEAAVVEEKTRRRRSELGRPTALLA